MQYVLVGDITPLFVKHKSAPLAFHKSDKCRINYERQLEELKIRPLSGPLHIDVVFHLPFPNKSNLTKQKELNGKPHTNGSKVSYLLNFLEFLRKNQFYTEESVIASLHVKKVYSYEPRTEFTITEIS